MGKPFSSIKSYEFWEAICNDTEMFKKFVLAVRTGILKGYNKKNLTMVLLGALPKRIGKSITLQTYIDESITIIIDQNITIEKINQDFIEEKQDHEFIDVEYYER